MTSSGPINKTLILKLTIDLLSHHILLPLYLHIAELYQIQKDNFSHANLTISNSDIHIALDDDSPIETGRMVPVPNLIQQIGYPELSDEQSLVSNCMVISFSIQPCETLNQEANNINLFAFRGESIPSAYEGAGYPFSTQEYKDASKTPVHFQGFEILYRFHIPSSVHNQVLWKSLHPNIVAEMSGDNFLINPPCQRKWNKGFDYYFRTRLHRLPTTNSFLL